MSLILGTNKQSKCMYCNAETYGKGCPYSPHNTHVHADDPKRCIYCGAAAFGTGCVYNPFGKHHVHGVEYNTMMRENVHSSLSTAAVLLRLSQPIIESAAYKHGIVDEDGNRLKIPETIEEKKAFTPLDAYMFKLRNFITESQLQLLNSSVIIELASKPIEDSEFLPEKYEKNLEIRDRLKFIVNEYKSIMLDSVQSDIKLSEIENMLIECLLDDR